MFSLCRYSYSITDAGILGWALQYTYTLSAKGLQQPDFNRQKRSLENFSLPLVTLWKKVGTHKQQYTTCAACTERAFPL